VPSLPHILDLGFSLPTAPSSEKWWAPLWTINAHFEVCDEAGDGAQVVEKSYEDEAGYLRF
jgi:hypothetical protein